MALAHSSKTKTRAGSKVGRPKADATAIRREILSHAETLLRESAGQRLRLSDVAARMDRAPSYVHLYFASKHELVAALARQWFSNVESAARTADEALFHRQDPERRVRAQILAIMTVKRRAFEDDPVLFQAYLRLAADHMDIVVEHTGRLRSLMRAPIAELAPQGQADFALEMLEDATTQFRVPHMIALTPDRATPERANRVMDAVFLKIRSGL